MKVKSLSRSVVSDSGQPHGLQPIRLLHPWDFPGEVLEWGAIAFSSIVAGTPQIQVLGFFLELSVISPTPKCFLSAVDEELTGYQHFSLVLLFVEPL